LKSKVLVEASDILSFHFECPQCGWSTAIPVSKFLRTDNNEFTSVPVNLTNVPEHCHRCGARRKPERKDPTPTKIAADAILENLRWVQSESGLSFSFAIDDSITRTPR
jgi:hypothetical protein